MIGLCLNPLEFADRGDLAEFELLAFLDIDDQEEPVAFLCEFGIGAVHTEIDIAARQVEIAQDLAVKLHPVFDQRVRPDEIAQDGGLLCLHHAAQTAI